MVNIPVPLTCLTGFSYSAVHTITRKLDLRCSLGSTSPPSGEKRGLVSQTEAGNVASTVCSNQNNITVKIIGNLRTRGHVTSFL